MVLSTIGPPDHSEAADSRAAQPERPHSELRPQRLLQRVTPVSVLVLGWIAAVVNSFFTLPQVYSVLRTRSVAGVSVLSWQIMLGANLGWVVHGFLAGYANIWVPNAFLLLCTSAILSVIRQQTRTGWARLILPGLGLATLMVGLDVLAGPIAYALSAVIPSALAQVMQLRSLVHQVNVSGVSLPFLALSVATQALWLSWSLLVGEVAITVAASSLGALMAVNLVWALLRHFRLVRATLATF